MNRIARVMASQWALTALAVCCLAQSRSAPPAADSDALRAELYARYHDQGLEILGMDIETWGHDHALPKGGAGTTNWIHVNDSTATRLAKDLFAVQSLPAKVLIDTRGFVIGSARSTKISTPCWPRSLERSAELRSS